MASQVSYSLVGARMIMKTPPFSPSRWNGLPVMWAHRPPEDAGTYFAWGETEGKEDYNWDNYRYATPEPKMTKYNFPDGTAGSAVLEAGDDAATVNLGNGWRMPPGPIGKNFASRAYKNFLDY